MEENIKQQFSSLGQNLLAGQDDPSGDPLIKKIFSNREVLAWLVVHFFGATGKIEDHSIQIWNHNAMKFKVNSSYPLQGALVGLPMSAIDCREIES